MHTEPITDRQALIDALREAATVEHDVICRYLYGAFSLKTDREEGGVSLLQLETMRDWRSSLYRVAREEMGHLGLVCNLLTAVGAPAFFESPRCRGASGGLHSFSLDTLDAFIRIEREHDSTAAPGSIGAQYARIRRGFERLGSKNPLLFIGARRAQVDNDSLDLPQGWFNFNLHPVVDVPSACSALDLILEESDGSAEATHADRFEAVRRSYAELLEADPNFDPVRSMAEDPSIADGIARISHPITRSAAELFNAAYEVMLMLMLRFFGPAEESDEERDVLQRTAFFPLMTMVLRPLGELLSIMPMEEGASASLAAGPTFECRSQLGLPPETLTAWTVLQERLDDLDERCEALVTAARRSEPPWSRLVQERLEFLSPSLKRIAVDFRRRMNTETIQVRHVLKQIL